MTISRTLIGLFAAILIAPIATPKCISLRIVVRGRVAGSSAGNPKLSLQIASATRPEALQTVRQEVSLKDGRFEVTGWFNEASDTATEEVCDRLPGLVVITLGDSTGNTDRQQLEIQRDFRRTKHGYQTIKPIILRMDSH